jgi:hypothetical protein
MKKLILILLAFSILVSVSYSKPKKAKPKCGATGFADCPRKVVAETASPKGERERR